MAVLLEPNGIVNPVFVILETDYIDCHLSTFSQDRQTIGLRMPGYVAPSPVMIRSRGDLSRRQIPGLYYASIRLGTGYPKVDMIHVMNGGQVSKTIIFDPPVPNDGQAYTVKVVDLGAYYRFNRGLNMAVHITNSAPYNLRPSG